MLTGQRHRRGMLWVIKFLGWERSGVQKLKMSQVRVPTDPARLLYMWCDQSGKISLKSKWDIFRFLFDWSAYLDSYILLKTQPESGQWFQSYEQLKDSQNNRKQKKFNSFFGLGLYLTTNASNFRLDSARSQHIFWMWGIWVRFLFKYNVGEKQK